MLRYKFKMSIKHNLILIDALFSVIEIWKYQKKKSQWQFLIFEIFLITIGTHQI